MPKSAEQLRNELERWLRSNYSTYNGQAILAERKKVKAIATAKADVYKFVADMVASWDIGQ